MQIYYGSNVIVNQTKIITDGFYKDYEEIKKDCGLIAPQSYLNYE